MANVEAGVWQVDVSLDGGRWWRWACSRVEFMGAGGFELDVYGPAEIVVVSWAYLTHAESMVLPVKPGDRLFVQVRDGNSVWCCDSVVLDVHWLEVPVATRLACALRQVADAGGSSDRLGG